MQCYYPKNFRNTSAKYLKCDKHKNIFPSKKNNLFKIFDDKFSKNYHEAYRWELL